MFASLPFLYFSLSFFYGSWCLIFFPSFLFPFSCSIDPGVYSFSSLPLFSIFILMSVFLSLLLISRISSWILVFNFLHFLYFLFLVLWISMFNFLAILYFPFSFFYGSRCLLLLPSFSSFYESRCIIFFFSFIFHFPLPLHVLMFVFSPCFNLDFPCFFLYGL